MRFSEEKKDTEGKYLKDNDPIPIPEKELRLHQSSGSYIGSLDFIIWTIIPFIGILFCLIHTEQEHLWEWIGDTPAEAQSFEAKTIVSIISAIIGGCVAATLLKTVKTVSFTLVKYRGADFSQLAAMIGGFSISNVPMLSAGNGWLAVLIIILLLIISTITKQLAVISMTVSPALTSTTASHYTRNYTTCLSTNYTSEFSRRFPIFGLEALNSVRNQNASYTNEYYDRSIPEGLEGISNFERVLPFANASCIPVPRANNFSVEVPHMEPIKSTINPVFPSAWSTLMSIVFDDRIDEPTARTWLNCTIIIGHATASTSCNDTLCETHRTSEITPYIATNYGLTSFMERIFAMINSDSSSINLLQSWLAGGNITTYYDLGRGIPGESVEIIEERSAILGTVIGRIICDRNAGKPYDEVTNFDSYFERRDHYVYHVLWKWPFWLIIALIVVSWLVCMFTMWITPESRVMSVEWLLSQYITRDKWGYISGRGLVYTHEGSLFQVVDQKPDEEIGNIVISKIGVQSDIRNKIILHKKRYQ